MLYISKERRIMLKARYIVSIALTEEEAKQLDELKKKKVKSIEVFRKGLEVLSK